jgi:hypothetical protein
VIRLDCGQREEEGLVAGHYANLHGGSLHTYKGSFHTISDHAAILLSTEGPVKRIKNTFKFENRWLKESDFNDYAKKVWNVSKHKSFSNRTNHLAGQLKIWCKKKKPLQQELNSLEEQIKAIQMKPSQQQDHTAETSVTVRYE